MQKEIDIAERRRRRVTKLQEYYFAKAYLVLQIGRCLCIAGRNFGSYRELILSQLLSRLYSVPKVKLGTGEKLRNIKSLLFTFNKAMRYKLDYERDCELRSSCYIKSYDYNVITHSHSFMYSIHQEILSSCLILFLCF